MKSNIFTLLFLACFIMLTGSCDKQETLNAEPPKVIKLSFEGSTTRKLEFLYRDKVIAAATPDPINGSFITTVMIGIGNNAEDIQIREEGSTNIINTRSVTPSKFQQNITLYYEGGQIYSQTISYQIKGYALSGDLEFLLDGNVIAEGTSAIDKTITIPVNENVNRELQVRRKGTTEILVSKPVSSSPATGQSLKFFYDGTAMVDNVQINLPVNPANMAINAQFKSTLTTSTSYTFIGGDEIDLVFYTRNKTTNVIAKANPEVRVTLPTNGTFKSFELPPLPDANYEYKFDICAKGTNTSPYDASRASIKPIALNEGKSTIAGTSVTFEAGGAKLFLVKDSRQLRVTPSPPSNIFVGQITDLSQYFK